MADFIERRWGLPDGEELVVRVALDLEGFAESGSAEVILPECIAGGDIGSLMEALRGALDLVNNRFQFHKVLGY